MIFKLERLQDFHLNFESAEDKIKKSKSFSKKLSKKKRTESDQMEEISEKPGQEDESDHEEEEPEEESPDEAKETDIKSVNESQQSTTADNQSVQSEFNTAPIETIAEPTLPEPTRSHPEPERRQVQTPSAPEAPQTPEPSLEPFDLSRLKVPSPTAEQPEEAQQRILDAQNEQKRTERYFIEEEKEDSIENKYFSGLLPGLTQTQVRFLPLSDTLEKISEKKKFQGLFDVVVQGFLASTSIRGDSTALKKILKEDGILYQENCQ